MNMQESDILQILINKPFINQRILSEESGYSLGVVNRSLRRLMETGYLNEQAQPTFLAKETFRARAPHNAIILAAGLSMRTASVNMSTPNALLEVNRERMIERIITQLHDVGVRDITVVVGFMKESFEYLMDAFGVKLVVNPDYVSFNNLHSLALVADCILNTYIVPCDIWCKINPFSRTELYSWYMVSDRADEKSTVRVNRSKELVMIPEKDAGNAMIGICYLLEEQAKTVREKLKQYDADGKHAGSFWEETLYQKNRMILHAKEVRSSDVAEINSFDQIYEFESDYRHLKHDAIKTITSAFGCGEEEVTNISVLKKGMTNRSFLFSVRGSKYIIRIPGEGTDQMINRKNEAAVFQAISGLGLCDDPVFINPENGYKITKYLDNVRVCDSESVSDLERCMEKLRGFHGMKLKVAHTFDIFGQIEFYESLWNGNPSMYRDYQKTKENVFSLKSFIERQKRDFCLTHIDAVNDNFLFYHPEGSNDEQLQLTDWEYSGMQDPHVDIAMFCIYSLYDKRRTDRLIDLYFNGDCGKTIRTKIYCYIASCGLLWSNWCEYKRMLGVEFGEYSLRQYRYAKDYYRYAKELMQEETGGI